MWSAGAPLSCLRVLSGGYRFRALLKGGTARNSCLTGPNSDHDETMRTLESPCAAMSRFGVWGGMIDAVATLREFEIDASSPPTEVLPLELSVGVRPVGRLLLLGQVPSLAPFRGLRGARLWMRWVEPDLDDAQIEIAAEGSRDERPCTARVLARASVPDRAGAWALVQACGSAGACRSPARRPRRIAAGGPAPARVCRSLAALVRSGVVRRPVPAALPVARSPSVPVSRTASTARGRVFCGRNPVD